MTDGSQKEMPNGWQVASLRMVTEVNPKLDTFAGNNNPTVSFVPMPAVGAGTGTIDVSLTRSLQDVKKGYRHFRQGDVLFAKITPCMENGKMAIVPSLKYGHAFGSTEFHVLRPERGINAQFIYYFVSSQQFRRDAQHNMTGAVGQLRVPAPYLADQSIPVPPTREQCRIVAKIEELCSELDKGIESLKTARARLDVYRQAVLKHAFEGKLTADWRKQNKDKTETPEQLLARIKQERMARYETQLQEWKAAVKAWEENKKTGRKSPKPRKLSQTSPPSLDELESLPCLPLGWTYLNLGLVVDQPKYGTPKKCDYNYDGTGVLRIPNVIGGLIDTSDLKGACFGEDEKRIYSLRSGDVLMVRSNGSASIVGKCALVSEMDAQLLFAGYLIRLRSNPAVLLPDYLIALLSSHLLRTQIEQKAKSTSGVNNINSGEIQSVIIPLCNPDEQKLLIERLSAILSTIDDLHSEIGKQLIKANALRQSILKEAFSGRLVAQDPDDEPASVLLERIAAEKEARSRNTVNPGKRRRAVAAA